MTPFQKPNMTTTKTNSVIVFMASLLSVFILLMPLTANAQNVIDERLSSLIKDLQSPDRNVRSEAAESLGELGDRAAVQPLIQALKDPDEEVRSAAAKALGELRDKAAVQLLIEALSDTDGKVRAAAADALRWLRDKAAVPSLIIALKDPEARVRSEAAKALEELRDKAAVAPLIQALKDRDREVGRWAARALGVLGDRKAVPALIEALGNTSFRVRSEVAKALGELGDRKAVPPLIASLNDANGTVRFAAAEALRMLRDKAAVPSLVKTLKDPDPRVRSVAAESLGELGDEAVVRPLIEALNDPDNRVSSRAARALGKIGDSAAVAPLIETLKNPDSEVRLKAVDVLGSIKGRAAVAPLIEALKDTDSEVRLKAAENLGRVGEKAAVPSLIKALKDLDSQVRSEAAGALGELRDGTAVEPLIEALKDTDGHVRDRASRALGGLGDKKAVQPLIETLRSPDVWGRFCAAEALIGLGDKGAVEPLIEALKDTGGGVRSEAARALGAIGDRAAVPPLLVALNDPDSRVRSEAAGALGQLRDGKAVQPLIEALKDSDSRVRSEAAGVLGQLRDGKAVQPLIEALKDSDSRVRSRAAVALGELGERTAVQPLIEALKDPEKGVCFAATQALGQLRDGKAVQPLIEALKDSDSRVRSEAARALGVIGDRAAVPSLIDALKSTDRWVGFQGVEALGVIGDKAAVEGLIETLRNRADLNRERAAETLGRLGDKTAIPALIEALEEDTDGRVRSKAAEALGRLGDGKAVQPLIEALKDGDSRVRSEAAGGLGDMGQVSEIYKAFLERPEILLFNLLRKDSRFDDNGLKQLTGSDDLYLKSIGHYLLALRSQQEADYEKQVEYSKEALKYIDPKIDTALCIVALWLKAEAEIYLSKPKEAADTVKTAENLLTYLSRRERQDYRDLFDEYTLFLKGEVYARLNEEKAAIATYEAALEQLKTHREQYWLARSDVERLESYITKRFGTVGVKQYAKVLAEGIKLGEQYNPATRFEMEVDEDAYAQRIIQESGEGNYEEAQQLIEKLSLRRTKYLNRKLDIKLAYAEKQKSIDEYKIKQKSIEALEEKKRSLAAKEDGRGVGAVREEKNPEIEKVEAEIRAGRRELVNFINSLKKSYPDLAVLLGAKPIELKNTQEQLSPETALLQYLILPGKLVIFIIRATTIDVQEEPLNIDIKAKVKKHKALLSKIDKSIEKSKRLPEDGTLKELDKIYSDLYHILIKPVEGKLKGIMTLGISPNGYLHYIPFGALWAEEGGKKVYLIDKYKSIFYINSTSLFWIASDRTGKSDIKETKLVAYINPDESLKYAKDEEKDLETIFKKKDIYYGKEAKKENLETIVLSDTVLHFSTHGRLNSVNSTQSYLVMADNKHLTVQEIWGLPLKGNVVTTLSACETGVGQILSGDDIVSLENAFIYAGSPSVVSTLWKVDERATGEITKAFYKNLVVKKMGKAEALTQAQVQVKNDLPSYKDPYFWAGFTLRGTYQ